MLDDGGPRALPPFGFHYPEHGSGAEPIRANSFTDLVDAIIQDRVSNRKPIGDPAYDVREYVLKNWPHHAGSVSIARPSIREQENSSQKELVAQWVANRYALRAGGHTGLLSAEEAAGRAQVCEACPENKAYENHCAPCVAELSRTKFLLAQGASTGKDLKACAITHQDNEVACFLPEPMLKHRTKFLPELEEKAPRCWLLNVIGKENQCQSNGETLS